MKFGEIKTTQAFGSILAHGIRADGVDLKKGTHLREPQIDLLKRHGIDHVTAAFLDEDDIGEDDAARALAAAIAGNDSTIRHLRIDAPFTGRVNIHSHCAGVLVLDTDRITQINAVDPAITVATLPAHAAVQPGQMLATVKIIPFAANKSSLDKAITLAGQGSFVVAAFQARKIGLIQTQQPHTSPKMLDKTARITEERIAAVGAEMLDEVRCDHTIGMLTDAIRAAKGHGILLIAGATAITDIEDVLPVSIIAAGGRIIHFGMPVDPGNLLLLAELDGKPVIGLPGCARSPKLNGFDWILARLSAGLDVAASDIAAMGVGGLLAEILTRPQPRSHTVRQRQAAKRMHVGAIILAAGRSRRMGSVNKLLIKIDDKPMLMHALDAVRHAGISRIVVVTGHERQRIEDLLADAPVQIVANPDFAEGLSSSLRAGIQALGNEERQDLDGVLIALGDMPGIQSSLIKRMIEAFAPDQGRAIIVPTSAGKRGNPVLWSSAFLADMCHIKGDVGARHLIGEHIGLVHEIEAGDDTPLIDLDTPETVERYRPDDQFVEYVS